MLGFKGNFLLIAHDRPFKKRRSGKGRLEDLPKFDKIKSASIRGHFAVVWLGLVDAMNVIQAEIALKGRNWIFRPFFLRALAKPQRLLRGNLPLYRPS